jgi:transketolase
MIITNKMNDNYKQTILEVSYKNQLTHVGSCLTAADIIDKVYQMKQKGDKVVLSSGHAGLALYSVIEKYEGIDAEGIYNHHGVHPDRCDKCHIDCSSGSLGQGLPIAVGMALGDPKHNVYCVTSDGEWAEGSMWEALRIASDKLIGNLIILVNANGYSAMGSVDRDRLQWRIASFVRENFPKVAFMKTDNPEGLEGVAGHYKKLDDKLYKSLMEKYA